MPTANDYRNFIRGQKDKNCPPYSNLDKEGLRKLAIKMGWTKYTDVQRGAMSIQPKKREKKEIKETKEVKTGTIPEMRKEAERLKKLYEDLRTKAEAASASGRGYQKILDEAKKANRQRFEILKKIKIRSGSVIQK